jgi:hypothetical protein
MQVTRASVWGSVSFEAAILQTLVFLFFVKRMLISAVLYSCCGTNWQSSIVHCLARKLDKNITTPTTNLNHILVIVTKFRIS